MVKFENEKSMISYICSELNFEPNISIVVSKKYINEIIESIDFDYKMFTKELNLEVDTYLIDKYEDNNLNLYVVIQPLSFDGEGCLETCIENDFVIIQQGLLDEGNLQEVYAEEELTIVDYEEDNSNECLQDCRFCNGCDDEQCICFDEEEIDEDVEIIDEYLEEKVQEFMGILDENLDNDEFCFHCAVKELLEQVYCMAYEDGKKELALSLGDLLGEIAEN